MIIKMIKQVTLQLFLLIITTSLFGAVKSQTLNPLKNPNICGLAKCEIEDEKFGFSINTIYRYALESSQVSLFDGTDNNDPLSQVFISGFAEIHFPTKCQGELRLSGIRLKYKNITILESNIKSSEDDVVYEDEEETTTTFGLNEQEDALHPNSYKFAQDLEKSEIQFDFHDGKIQEICPKTDESVWITNFKRGIISSFQNTMSRFDLDHKTTESDISGKCEVLYQFIGSEKTSIRVQKTKDLSSCQNRNKFKSIIQTTPYEFRRNDISWWPIYNSTSFCILSIDNYIYNRVECHDHHVLIPFSNGKSGAAAKSSISLLLLSEIEKSKDVEYSTLIESRKSLIYDHSFSPKPTHHEIKVSREYLRQMCSLGFPNIQREFPDRFVKFLAATRHLSTRGLQQLMTRAAGICNNGKKHILESLPFIESSASTEIMKDLIVGKLDTFELNEEMIEKWMNSIFYLPRPDESTIETMFSFIQFYEAKLENSKPVFILIPTSVTHTFCKSHFDCRSVPAVMNIVKFLETLAMRNLAGDLNDKITYEKAIVALKGLGNVGIMSKSFEDYLKDLIIDETVLDDVKLQIVEVFRKTNCDKSREFFVDIYQNYTQSVEMRIASYLQFMKCPTYKTIKKVKTFLPTESVNQVASFVWSHLTNLAKTSSPQKVELQGLLADNRIDEKNNFDFRKFSKYHEYSLFFEEYNFGISGESNVIFGTESYLPRYIQFNGTINLFGNSLNPLEFAMRIKGMESYIESIFGLNGALNFDKLIDKFGFVFENFKNLFNFEDNIVNSFLRSRRSVDNLVDQIAYQPKYEFNKPTGYFEYKVFGNDVNFYRFEGLNELSEIIKKIIPMEQMKGIFSKKEEVFIKSGTLIDVSYTVPLSSGFPLILSGFGAYSLDMRYFAGLNNADNAWETKTIDFIGRIKPALSMEFQTMMQIDMFHATTDARVKSNVYSNYAIETELKVKSNEHASLKMKLPQDRNDILSIQTHLLSSIKGEDTILYGITNRYQNTSCSWPSVNDMLGLKVCVDYLLPDVNDVSKGYPSLVLSGPIIFDIHLDKADLSAILYNFEYQWTTEGKDKSHASITFETPNTKIPRKFSAFLKSDHQSYNLSMGFINGEQTQTALGFIKLSPEEKSANFSLMVNKQEHFRTELSLKTKRLSKSKMKYSPLFLLIINKQKIAGMNGHILQISKHNVTQNDIDLRFETKKMLATASGQIIKTQTSFTTKMLYVYQFSNKKEETIEIDTELANRSQKSRARTEYNGKLKFVSSAYNHYNFASDLTFLSSLGHVETKLELNNAEDLIDPNYTLVTRITLAKNSEDSQNSRTIFAIEATRPKSSTDVKFQVTYDEKYNNGTEHNVAIVMRYAPSKEVHARGVVWIPRGQLFGLDANFSLIVPDLNKCFGSIKIRERIKRDFYFDITGEWFSGENIRAQGLYQDRTSNVKRFHRLKSIISSKLFDDINLDLKYARDLQELKFKAKTEYKKKSYSFNVESIDVSLLESLFKSELEWGENLYSIIANSSYKDNGRMEVEVHLDRIRDLHLEIWGIAKRFSNKCGVQFQWDANRDPSQQMILSYEFDKPKADVYIGDVMISYPERTFNGKLNISNVGPYTGDLKVAWGVDEAIDVGYSVGSEIIEYQKLWLLFKIDTPFNGWKSNRVNGTYFQQNNLMNVNFAVIWAEFQRIGFEFFVDYLLSDAELSGELKAEIDSTIKDIPIVTAQLKHSSTIGKIDSEILFKHNFVNNKFRTFWLKSLWKSSMDEVFRNITGAIKFKSPLVNYNSGVLLTKFSLTKDREILGVIDVDIDSRMYSFTIDGYMKKLLDNMISFNLTTPIDTFPYLHGKFGIIEMKKYIIADLRTPNKSLGIEVLYDFKSITDFDLKFYLATPQPALEKILAIGKIKEDTVHVEGAWNKIILGFKGVWRFASYKDFEYSYLVFTPLKNFSENGLIVKLIANNIQNFDIESSLKLGKYKVGIKGLGEPRTQIINQLGFKKASYIREDFQRSDELDSDEKTEGEKVDIIDLSKYYSVVGRFEICTVVWSPITGNYEIQQIDETFHGNAKIYSPKGLIEVKNRFVLRGKYHYLNRLNISTPFNDYKIISSNFKLKIPQDNQGFTIRFDVGASDNKMVWKNYGFKIAYVLPKHQQLKIHDVTLIILYPLEDTTRITISSRIELQKGTIRSAVLSIDGFHTQFKMFGNFNQMKQDIDLKFGVSLKSPSVSKYGFDTYFKKKTVNKNNQMKAGFTYIESMEFENNFDAILDWRLDDTVVIDGDLFIISNIFPINRFNTSVYITETKEPEFKVKINYETNPDRIIEEMKFHILRNGLKFEGEVVTPYSDYSNVRFNGFLEDIGSGNYKAKGTVFKNLLANTFEGDVALYKNLPTKADLIIKNTKNEANAKLSYEFVFEENTRKIQSRISSLDEKQFITFESELYIQKLIDWAYNVKIQSSKPEFDELKLSTTLNPLSKTQLDASFEMISPWKHLMIHKVNVSSLLTLNVIDGNFQLFYEVSELKGIAKCEWKWLQRLTNQNYLFKVQSENQDRKFSSEISFKNSTATPTDLTFKVDVNSIWALSSKVEFDVRNTQEMFLNYDLNLPSPVKSNHKFNANFEGTEFPPKLDYGTHADLNVNYENEKLVGILKSKGSLMKDDIKDNLNLQWGPKKSPKQFDSDFSVKKIDDKYQSRWQLVTPYYKDEKTLDLEASLFTQEPYNIVHATIHAPESNKLAVGDVAIEDLSNMKGNVNCSLPIFNITWFTVVFDFESKEGEATKFINATWPDNEAIFNSVNSLTDSGDHKKLKGTVKAEIPIQSKHAIEIMYELEEKPLTTTGAARVDYNTENIITSQYTCKTENLNENEIKDVVFLRVENKIRPIGVHFTHLRNKPEGERKEFSKKHIEIFDTDKENRFNLTGEFTVEIQDEKQIYTLVAIHPNRTIKWTSQYDVVDVKTIQSSKIELAKNIWLGYNVEITNKSIDSVDDQELKLKISYPTRDITIGGNYMSKVDSLDTNINVEWIKLEHNENSEENEEDEEKEVKKLEGSLQWRDLEYESKTLDHQRVILGLKHPLFEKDVTLKGNYIREKSKKTRIEVEYDYADDSNHLATFSSEILNLSEDVGYKNYSINVFAIHPISELELEFNGSIGLKINNYKVEANGKYKRSYLGERLLDLEGYLNSENREVKYYRSTPNQLIDIKALAKLNYPVYSVEGIFYDSGKNDYETKGVIELNLPKKLIDGNINFTDDGSQNLKIIGRIPDTRSAKFNIWRNYDDVRIDDIKYFIQMNHSRLITSKISWRPKMRVEIKNWIKKFTTERYKAVAEDLDDWLRDIYTETKESIADIYENSQGHLRPFLEDLSAIKDIDEDFTAFRNFLNESYNADDFYIQSFMNYTMTVMSDLAITDHLQQIPKIFKEMWEVLGESSAAFKSSITWIIETIKTSYKESIEIFNKLLQSNSLEHVTEILEKVVEKYDAFVKELHVTFLQTIETMWDNFMTTLNIYWNRVLHNIEPLVVKSIHYVESLVWGISNEIFDFMYNRTNELYESPYFAKVSNITHDLDVLYQDVSNNDMFTNVKKYSGRLWNFVREKFVNLVPFGKEMKEFASDIANEFRELKKVEPVREAVERFEDVHNKFKWLLNEFQFDKRLNMIIEIIKVKLTRITQSALETEDIYREAKTKFIFDPDVGVLDWEQKLPMAWHAFNETPQFEEIPEYRLFNDVQAFFFTKSNKSIWNFYYEMRLLSEPQNLFPPFKAHAFLIGSKYVVTYDNENVNLETKTLDDSCYHLLAHDFIDNGFTLILKRKSKGKSLIIKADKTIEIDLGNSKGMVKIDNSLSTILPALIGDTKVTRDFNVLTISSQRGFVVICNLEFDVCSIHLSGWHFGKVAGIFGTMNNEKFDDLMKSNNEIVDNEEEFVESWKLNEECGTEIVASKTKTEKQDEEASLLCSSFFRQKTSYFSSCFSAIDPEPFYQICMNSEANEKIACTAGIAYIEACSVQNIPLRVPDSCIFCRHPNGSDISEGSFITLKDESISQTVDIVFLVESKSCNVENLKRNFFSNLVNTMSSEFKNQSIDAKFSVIGFGGTGEFENPQSVTLNGEFFTTSQHIKRYFNHLKSGNGASDVFTALTVASRTIFRPGSVKIFILSLCSKCEYNFLKFDLKSVSQLLRENDITLHIISEYSFNEKRVIGVDKTKAYIRTDQTKLIGNELLRNKVAISNELGQCGKLAFDVNGSIFTTNFNKKTASDLKVVTNIFGKRIANDLKTKPCHVCECEGHNSGTAFLTCISCEKQMTSHDYEFEGPFESDFEDNYDD